MKPGNGIFVMIAGTGAAVPERVHDNTSAAPIPIALNEAASSGCLAPGSIVAMVGFGAGLTWERASPLIGWRCANVNHRS
jgi:hypothetical protein